MKARGRPLKIPLVGDVTPKAAAQRMGVSEERFLELLPRLLARNFPKPDVDTGNFMIEAIDAWRLSRYPHLYPQPLDLEALGYEGYGGAPPKPKRRPPRR